MIAIMLRCPNCKRLPPEGLEEDYCYMCDIQVCKSCSIPVYFRLEGQAELDDLGYRMCDTCAKEVVADCEAGS